MFSLIRDFDPRAIRLDLVAGVTSVMVLPHDEDAFAANAGGSTGGQRRVTS